MIHLIDAAITDRVTTCLAWLERWGGLVIPVQKKVQAGDGWVSRIFPVSCSVDPDCNDDSKFQKVLPNSAYKSVGYLYQVGQAATNYEGPKDNFIIAKYRLRLVVWLNYQNMGLDDCNSAGVFELETIASLRGRMSVSSDQLASPGDLMLSEFSILPKEAAAAFAPFYAYDKPEIYFWPYGFFAIEFSATARVNLACLSALEIGNETQCLTNW